VVGLPTTEVAEVLQVPVGTAKSYISRGLAVLRRDLRAERSEQIERIERPGRPELTEVTELTELTGRDGDR
jgi:hypothetical protein